MAEEMELTGREKQLGFVVDWVTVGKKPGERTFLWENRQDLVLCLVCASLSSGKAQIPSWDTWLDLILQAGG